MKQLRWIPVVATAIAVAGTMSTPARATPTSRPAAVSALAAFENSSDVRVAWTNPRSGFDRVILRYAKGAHAPSATHGTAVPLAARATSATLANLAGHTRYSVTVWTRDRRGHLSAPTSTSFTTAPGQVAAAANGALSGTVTDIGGHPLGNARVGAANYATGFTVETTTHGDGRYTLSVAPGSYFLGVLGTDATGGNSDATGYISDYRSSLTVTVHHTTTVPDSVLSAGGAITGRVTDRGGRPLSGVVVDTEAVSAFVPVFSDSSISFITGTVPTATGTDGTFAIRGTDGTAVRLCFTTTDARVTGGASDAFGYTGRCAPQSVAAGPGTARAVAATKLTSAHGGGIAVDATRGVGRPASGADISVYAVRGNISTDVIADRHGRAVATSLPAARYWVCASLTGLVPGSTPSPGYVTTCVTTTVSPGVESPLALHLRVGAAVSGTVRGPSGAPVPGAVVGLNGGSPGYAVTDRFGHYTAAGLAPGRYVACAQADTSQVPGLPTGVLPGCYGRGTRVLAVRGANRIGIDVRLAVAGSVTGTVTDPGGGPVSGVDLFAFPYAGGANFSNATSGPAGHYRLTGMATAKYEVCALLFHLSGATQHACKTSGARVGTTTRGVNFVLRRTATLVVHAADPSGVALAGVDAVLLKPCSSSQQKQLACDPPVRTFGSTRAVQVAASSMTFADGTVALDGVAPGKYALCLLAYDATVATGAPSASGYADKCTAGFDVTVAAGAANSASLTLVDGAAVSGRVTAKDGTALAGVRVYVSGAPVVDSGSLSSYDDGPAAITAKDGSYHFDRSTPGPQTVCFDASHTGTPTIEYLDQCIGGKPGGTDDGASVILSSGPNTGVDIALTPHRRGTKAMTARATTALTAQARPVPRSGHAAARTTYVMVRRGNHAVAVAAPAAAAWWPRYLSRLGAGA